MLNKFDKFLITIELLFCEILIVVLVAVVFFNAVLRLFNNPLNWSTDVAQLIFIWLSFVGADLALKKGKHSGVDVITRNLPNHVKRITFIIIYMMMVVFLAVIGYSSANLAILNISRKFHSMPFTYSSVTFAVTAGCLLLIYTSLRKMFALIRQVEDPYNDVLEDPETVNEEEAI